MRYKATFIAGVAVGYVFGTRAGRARYDQLVRLGNKIAGHPKVQQATSTVQAKATELTKTAAAKAPEAARTAATNAAKAASEQVPKLVSSARQATAAATDKIPARFGGTGGTPATVIVTATDDIAPDGSLVYPVDGESSSVNGTGYPPEMP
jgi:septal ring factor EnvC (AmiA/AmiB activator)